MKLVALLPALLLFLLPAPPAQAELPDWRESWQSAMINWFKTIKEDDVAFTKKEWDWAKLEPGEYQRTHLAAAGNYAPIQIAMAAMHQPSEAYTWKGLWKPEDETPVVLAPYGITKGALWIPSGPTSADSLAWLYSWKRPWNPYQGDKALAWRAAVISMVDLIMIRENVHYYTSGEQDCRQPPFRGRACESGFSLTFNAYAFLHVRDALPPAARTAWEEGLRWYAELNYSNPLGGPENMQLSVPVGIYYVGMALEDDAIKGWAQERMDDILDKHLSPAGYIRDAGVPDGSYNGISLHRLAEYWGMTGSPRVLEALRSAYALRQHLVLPEPGSGTLSPSHFNARCKDGFDRDQYQGREAILLGEIPDAAYFYRRTWQTTEPEQILHRINVFANRQYPRMAEPGPWKANHRWDAVMTIPNVQYHTDDEAAAAATIEANQEPIITRKDRYSQAFGEEVYAIRRPRYAALFYAGPAVTSDNGATNHRAMLKGEGGHLMGFSGGGLSAFWTPETATVLLGRLTGYETYARKVRTFNWGSYILSDWRDWLNNHVVGETKEGKVLTSARTHDPESSLSDDGNRLEISGTMLNKTRLQEEITNAELQYKRTYQFRDDGIDATLELSTNVPIAFKEFYEVLPLLTGSKPHPRAKEILGVTQWRFLDANGKVLEPKPITPPRGATVFENDNLNPITNKEEIAARVQDVHTVEITRHDGTARIVFPQPVNFALVSVEVISSQMTTIYGRTLLIELPTELEPGKNVTLRYQLQPGGPAHPVASHP